MSLSKSALVVGMALAVVAEAATITPVPYELHDRSTSILTRFCNYKIANGGHAKCEELRSIAPTVAWYRQQISEIYRDQSLTPDQRDAKSQPLADQYLPMLHHANDLSDQIGREQHAEYIVYCTDHVKEPICKDWFDRSLYEEEEEVFVTPTLPSLRSKATPMVFEEAELMDKVGNALIRKATSSRPLKKIAHKY